MQTLLFYTFWGLHKLKTPGGSECQEDDKGKNFPLWSLTPGKEVVFPLRVGEEAKWEVGWGFLLLKGNLFFFCFETC